MAPFPSYFRRSAAWDEVAKGPCLVDRHQKYWYGGLGLVLANLLQNAGYSQEHQTLSLHHFAVLVIPYLGPSLSPGPSYWRSFMTDDHTPVEVSWDFHTGSQQPTIRYSFEPVAVDAGTKHNPNNTGASERFKQSLVKKFPATDTTWFDHFEECFAKNISRANPEGHDSAIFWAFDLVEKGASAKAYFFPGAAAHATGRTNLQVMLEAIASAPGYVPGDFPSLDIYKDFAALSSRSALEMDMLALDLEPLEMSRLKIYFRDRRTDFASVRENMSLGGMIAESELEKGFQRLRKLWDAFFDTAGFADEIPLPHVDHRTAGILYNVEFRFRKRRPLVKVYIPVRHYARSDVHISEAMSLYINEEVAKRRNLAVAAMSAKLYRRCIDQTL